MIARFIGELHCGTSLASVTATAPSGVPDPRESRRHESGDCAGAQHDEGVDDHPDDDLNSAENESLSGRVSLPVIYELRDDRELSI